MIAPENHQDTSRKGRKSTETKMVGIRLRIDLYRRFKALADRHGVRVGTLGAIALAEFIRREERKY